MHSPKRRYLEVAYHILRYLKETPGKGLLFKKSKNKGINAFVDANWADSIENSISKSGFCTKLWGNLVTWRSKKQSMVARSSAEAEAEFRTIAQRLCEIISVEKMMKDLQLPVSSPKLLYCDSKLVISIVNNQYNMTR